MLTVRHLFVAQLAVALLSACAPRGRLVDRLPPHEAERVRCEVVEEILQTGSSHRYREASGYPDSVRLSWASSFSRGCGAQGGAALGNALRFLRHSRNADTLRYLSAPAEELLDSTYYAAALEVVADGSASEMARVHAARILMFVLRFGIAQPYRVRGGAARSPPGCHPYAPPLHWEPGYGRPPPADAAGQIRDVALRVQGGPGTPSLLRKELGLIAEFFERCRPVGPARG